MMRYQMSAVIIAGGKSSRMKEDKALLRFGGYTTLTAYQYNRLKPHFLQLYISAKEHKFDLDAKVIIDRYAASSPLVALLSIFETLDDASIFVLSVDAPFVSVEVVQRLMEESSEKDEIIIAKSPGGEQPLCGIYRRSILPLLREQFAKKEHKLKALFAKASTKRVYFESDEPFANLNYPDEYHKALKRVTTQA